MRLSRVAFPVVELGRHLVCAREWPQKGCD
jgi:hypothetical protein